MSVRGVRIGGTMAFATILIVPASAMLLGLATTGYRLQNLVLAPVLMYYAFVGCAAFVLWATKQVFNASGYRSADLAIGTLFAVLACFPPFTPLAWAWFSVLAIRFGRQTGSRLWQLMGIVYLADMILVAVAMTSFAGIDVPALDELVVLAGLLLLSGWLCHGFCLFDGARKMART